MSRPYLAHHERESDVIKIIIITCLEVFNPMLDLSLTNYKSAHDSQAGICQSIACAEQAQYAVWPPELG